MELMKIKYIKTDLFKHISTVFLWDNIAKFIGIITTIILIRGLSQEDYALFTMFGASLALFIGFISGGIRTAYVRFAAEEYSRNKKMPNEIFIISTVLCFTIFLILSPIIILFNKSISQLLFNDNIYSIALYLGFMGAIGFFFIGIVSSYYQVQEKYHNSGFILSFQKLLFFLLLLMLIIFGSLNFLKVAIIQIVLFIVFGLFLFVQILKSELLKNKLNLLINHFAIFLKASSWLILYCICISIFSHLDVLMIGRLKTANDLANYGVAYKYYGMLILALPSIMTVLRVRNSKIDMIESIEKQKEFVKKWLRMSSKLAIPIILIILVASSFVMDFLNGPRYTASILPFKILAVSSVFSYIFAPNISIFISMKKYTILFYFGLTALIINFFGNLWLISLIGISGAALATLFSHLIVNGFSTAYVLLKK